MSEGLAWPPRKEDLERLYLLEKMSAAKIAEVYGLKYKSPKVAESTVLHQLKINAIQRRNRAEHVRKATPEMIDAWVRRYEAGESLKQVAGEEVDPVTVWKHLRSRGVKLRDKIEAQIAAVRKYEKRPFEGDDIEKAYLTGFRLGDLDAIRHGRAIRVRVSTTHPAMARLFESLFSPYGHLLQYPRRSTFTGHEWNLETDLDDSFEFLLGKLSSECVDGLPPEEFRAFLAGFFDAEGTIYMHWKQSGYSPELNITNSDEPLMSSISRKLFGNGFHPVIQKIKQRPGRGGGLPSGVFYRIYVWRFEEVLRFLRIYKLRHPEKLAKCKLVRDLTRPPMTKPNLRIWKEWDNLILSIRKDRDRFIACAGETYETRRQGKNNPYSNTKWNK